mmetsp:Transcript_2854/g.4075  ORF Transcript_2854/g.4075 Transcript_2854/m.4075 type:complete len:231 (-) Transcript_2854:324-1016(-)
MGGALCFTDCYRDENVVPDRKILILGLTGAGKTTILMKIKGEENVIIEPTEGYNVIAMEYDNQNFNFWDLGGGKTRELWPHYYMETSGIIFVVDGKSLGNSFITEVEELGKILEHKSLLDCQYILVLLNKQDMAMKKLTQNLRVKGSTLQKFCNAFVKIGTVLEESEVQHIDDERAAVSTQRKKYVFQSKDGNTVKEFCIQTCSATRQSGISSGINWLIRNCNRKNIILY